MVSSHHLPHTPHHVAGGSDPLCFFLALLRNGCTGGVLRVSHQGTVIDWFQPWPMDALYNVGAKFLEPIEQLGPQDHPTWV